MLITCSPLFCCVILQGILLENLKLIARPQCFGLIVSRVFRAVIGACSWDVLGSSTGVIRQQRFFNVKGPCSSPKACGAEWCCETMRQKMTGTPKEGEIRKIFGRETMQMSCLFLSELLNWWILLFRTICDWRDCSMCCSCSWLTQV